MLHKEVGCISYAKQADALRPCKMHTMAGMVLASWLGPLGSSSSVCDGCGLFRHACILRRLVSCHWQAQQP
jgi:hypothetical protein